ncbi:glycerol ethanol, ferric requiring protein [Boothiomyces macroporosus]|uniref:Chloride channel protein n=1 Tax=Boothiomyces macroporosus TaxID=261099 RepID=A0AAD5UF45_9FUNG|nr:glycerol ethanol, ferric requiring protein [Boothiomyces macroporosus]
MQSANSQLDSILLSDFSNTNLSLPEPIRPTQSTVRRRVLTNQLLSQESKSYENFSTIDWMRDWVKDYSREHDLLDRRVGWEAWRGYMIEGMQSWVLLGVIAVSIGILVSWIDVVSAYLSDFKRGVCLTEWYLSKDICCKGLEREGEYCVDYQPWSVYMFKTKVSIIDFPIYLIVSVAFGTLAALIARFSKYTPKSGLSGIKTILGGFIIEGFLSARTLFFKSISLPLVVASSLSVGKEAPLIHIASSAAAGVAVAFGAPIGGVLFSLEELSSFFPSKTMLRSYFSALVACVTLQFVDPYRGKQVLYQVTYTRNWYFFEMFNFALLGVFGGLMGALFIKLNIRVQKYRNANIWLRENPIYEIAALALLSAVLCYTNIFTRVDGSELLESLFRECTENEHLGLCSLEGHFWLVLSLSWALLIKTGLTIVTYGTRIPAGMFVPSMIWGGLFGRILGEIMQSIHLTHRDWDIFADCPSEGTCVTPGMYALLGAIGALGGLTKLTVSLTVVMFELTGTLNYIIPCMVTLTISKFVGNFFGTDGYIEVVIKQKAYPYLDPNQELHLTFTVSDRMTPLTDLVCLTADGMTLHELEMILDNNDYQGYPIISSKENSNLVGYIDKIDITRALENIRALNPDIHPEAKVYFDEPELPTQRRISQVTEGIAPSIPSIGQLDNTPPPILNLENNNIHLVSYVNQTPLGVDPQVSMDFVIDLFKKMGPRYIVVKKFGRLIGLVTKKDALAAINEQMINQNQHLDSPVEPLSAHSSSDNVINSTELRYRTLTLEEELELLS